MSVRIDTLLHWLCLQKSRSMAARGCREGTILLNGRPVRPSKEVAAGDWISIADRRREGWSTIEITSLPAGQARRAAAREHYRPLAEQADASVPQRSPASAAPTRKDATGGAREGRA